MYWWAHTVYPPTMLMHFLFGGFHFQHSKSPNYWALIAFNIGKGQQQAAAPASQILGSTSTLLPLLELERYMYTFEVLNVDFWGDLGLENWQFSLKVFCVNLQNVNYTSVCQTVQKVWFICLFYCAVDFTILRTDISNSRTKPAGLDFKWT